MSKETLEELKAIVDNAPECADEFFIYQGVANYIDNRENGHQFKIWCEEEQEWVFSELIYGWQYIRGRRSLSDIEQIIELMEDKLRLDHLQKCNEVFNKRAGSNYGWRVDWNFNRIAVVDTGVIGLITIQAFTSAGEKVNE